MQHLEIIQSLNQILKLHGDFKKFEASLEGASHAKKTMPFDIYVQEIIRTNARSGGSIQRDLSNLIAHSRSARPDFNLNTSLSRSQMLSYSNSTAGKSKRMEKQLLLSKLLEVNALFKNEIDIFKPKKIAEVKKILKEMK